jgi:predicted nucleic-acid-binding Zn-ribbon protein
MGLVMASRRVRIPAYKEVKCDVISCQSLAVLFTELQRGILEGQKIFIRDFKVCEAHEELARSGWDLPVQERSPVVPLPYVDREHMMIQCLRCGHQWWPNSFAYKRGKKRKNYMTLPDSCAKCRNRSYRNQQSQLWKDHQIFNREKTPVNHASG